MGGGDKVRRKRGWVEGVDHGQRTWETSLGAHPASHPAQAFTQVVPRGLVSGERKSGPQVGWGPLRFFWPWGGPSPCQRGRTHR